MADKSYSSVLQLKDQFTNIMQKAIKSTKQMENQTDLLNKQLDKLTKPREIRIDFKLGNSFNNIKNQMDRSFPKNYQMKVGMNNDFSRSMDNIKRDMFSLQNDLDRNLGNSFNKMFDSANKNINSINGKLGNIRSPKINSASLTSGLTSGLTNGIKNGIVQGATAGLLGGKKLGKNLKVTSPKIEIPDVPIITIPTQTKATKKLKDVTNNTTSNSENTPNLKTSYDRVKSSQVLDKISNKSIKIPGVMDLKTPKIDENGMEIKLTALDKASNVITNVQNKLKEKQYVYDLVARDYASNVLKSLTTKAEKLRAFNIMIKLNDLVTKPLNVIHKSLGLLKKPITTLIKVKDMASNSISKIKSLTKSIKNHGFIITVKDMATKSLNKIKSLTKLLLNPVKIIMTAQDKASNVINKVKSSMKLISKPVKAIINAVDKAMPTIKKISSGLKSITSRAWTVTISAVDKATATISKIASGLKNLAKLASGIVIGAGVAGGTMAIKESMNFEQQVVSMKHFIGAFNDDMPDDKVVTVTTKYVQDLENLANATPFETGEIINAGRRAVQVAGGDVNQAMDLVKLSSDMAAMNPLKTVDMAMEARRFGLVA